MKPIRDGSKFGGIVHAVDATVIPQASERSNVVLWAILSTYAYKSLENPRSLHHGCVLCEYSRLRLSKKYHQPSAMVIPAALAAFCARRYPLP